MTAILFSSGPLLQDLWSSYCSIDNEGWLWYYLRSTITLLSPIGSYYLAIADWWYLNKDDEERWWFVELPGALLFVNLLDSRSAAFFLGSWVNLPNLLLFFWAIFAFEDFWQVFTEVKRWVSWQLRATLKKTLPRFEHVAKSKNPMIWGEPLECPWSRAGDQDLERLFQKEEDTRVFRLARRAMSKRRGWTLKSHAFKVEDKQLRTRHIRARACSYLFSSKLRKCYSVGMRGKREAQSTWRRLLFMMERSPCLWKSLKKCNIIPSFSDFISVLDFHPEWFSGDGTCLEAIRAPLRRLGLHISQVPLSLVPQQVLNGSEEHRWKYLFWRASNGKGHYASKFEPGDLCFEITDYLFLPGDLSSVFGSAEEKKDMGYRIKDLSHCRLAAWREWERWFPPEELRGNVMSQDESTTTSGVRNDTVANRTRSGNFET